MSTGLKWFAKIWAMAALAAVAFSCGVRAEIVIGVAVPGSGPKVEIGKEIRDGANAALSLINQKAGADGPVRLQIENDECTDEGGSIAARKLVAAQVAFVIGHPCSNSAIAAAKIYAAAGVVLLAIGARHPELTSKRAGPGIFRLDGRDDRQAVDTVAVLAERLSPAVGMAAKRIAIVHDRTAYARGLADGVAAGLRARNVASIFVETIVAGEKSYEELVIKLKSNNVDAVYFAGFPAEALVILNALRANAVSALFIGSDSAYESETWKQMGRKQLGEYAVMLPTPPANAGGVLVFWDGLRRNAGTDSVPVSADAWAKLFGTDANGDAKVPSFRAQTP